MGVSPGSAHPGNETGGRMDRRKVSEVGIFSIENFIPHPNLYQFGKNRFFTDIFLNLGAPAESCIPAIREEVVNP